MQKLAASPIYALCLTTNPSRETVPFSPRSCTAFYGKIYYLYVQLILRKLVYVVYKEQSKVTVPHSSVPYRTVLWF